MKTALIGYSGFVGGNILNHFKFNDLYNSKNIKAIRGHNYDLVVSAGVRAEKWLANQNPEEDLSRILNLVSSLKGLKTKNFILISTVDVYPKPYKVDEKTNIDPNKSSPYGKNRYYLEQFVTKNFPKTTIVRLPGLFGPGIKKNFIYDLIHNNRLDLTHYQSSFQFYNLANIWKDLSIAIKNNLQLVNFATEPVSAHAVAKYTIRLNFNNVTERPLVEYDMRTIYGEIFGRKSKYLYLKLEILKQLKEFVLFERSKLR